MLTSNPLFWGHSLEDYCEMFALTPTDLSKRILDCGGGPASFNAEMQRSHHRVISIDPIYDLAEPELVKHARLTQLAMLQQIQKEQARYVWKKTPSLEEFAKNRNAAIELFIADFPQGRASGRYLPLTLQALPFSPLEFDLALCSHYLFANRIEADLPLHLQIIHEILRVASEVRIFPLLDSAGNVSSLLGPLMLALQQNDLVGVELKEVPYQFQKQGNAMLRIWGQTCPLNPEKES